MLPDKTKIFKEINGEKSLAISYSQLDMFLKCPNRWFLQYWNGIEFDERYEALEYGSCVHEAYEYYANNMTIGKKLELAELECKFEEIFHSADIPFEIDENKEKALSDGLKAVKRLATSDGYVESLINKCDIIGVEEEFVIPISHVVDIEDSTFDCVYIVGAIDLILKKGDDIFLVDHKSGKKKFAKDKLDEDLQFPIYSKYILDKYGKLPKKCFYNFTRLGDFQEVKINDERITQTIRQIKNTITRMYRGEPYKSNPTPLCYWCNFSKTKHNVCESSSDWQPKEK